MTRKSHESPREIVVILDADGTSPEGERGALLDRMLGAIGLSRAGVTILGARQMNDAVLSRARAVLVFGRGLVELSGESLFVTRSLDEVIADPALKREVWADLQKFSRAAGTGQRL